MNYIYLIKTFGADKSLIKLGYTSDIKSRLTQYLYANPLYEVIQIYVVENALEFEQDFHKRYPSVFGNEWYEEDLLPTMLKEIESQVHEIYVPKAIPKITFKDVVEELKKGDSDYLAWAIEKYDFLKDALQYLGYDKIAEYEYSQTRIKRALLAFSDKDKEVTIKSLLEEYGLTTGVSTSNERLKVIFSEIYTKLGINKTPKAIDLEYYFNVKPHAKRINKKKAHGLIIL